MIASPSFDYIFFKTVIYKNRSDGHESQSRVTETLPRRFEVSPPSSLATSFSIFFFLVFLLNFSSKYWMEKYIFGDIYTFLLDTYFWTCFAANRAVCGGIAVIVSVMCSIVSVRLCR